MSSKLSREEEIRLFKLYKEQGDTDAREQLINSQMGFIKKTALAYNDVGMVDELIQVGVLTLMGCIDRFDDDSGNRLSTYIFHAIRGAMSAYRQQNRSIFSITSSIDLNLQRHFLQQSETDITEIDFNQIANDFNRNVEDIVDTFNYVVNKNQVISPDETILDELECDETYLPDYQDNERDAKKMLKKAFTQLTLDEKKVIFNRWIKYDGDITLHALAKRFGTSPSRQSQIEKSAFAKIKKVLKYDY